VQTTKCVSGAEKKCGRARARKCNPSSAPPLVSWRSTMDKPKGRRQYKKHEAGAPEVSAHTLRLLLTCSVCCSMSRFLLTFFFLFISPGVATGGGR
jgi:hypothetical protein